MVDAIALERTFSRHARAYSAYALVQRQIASELVEMLPGDLAPPSVLDIGCGTGFLTRELAERFPSASIVALDLAPGMVEQARDYLRPHENVKFICNDARNYQCTERFGLIASSSALHWISPLEVTLQSVAQWLTPGGMFAAALMVEGTMRELVRVRQSVSTKPNLGVAFPDADTIVRSLQQAGLLIEQLEQKSYLEEWLSTDEMLTSLHERGLTGAPHDRPQRLSAREYRKLVEFLRSEGIRSGNYEVLFFVARRES